MRSELKRKFFPVSSASKNRVGKTTETKKKKGKVSSRFSRLTFSPFVLELELTQVPSNFSQQLLHSLPLPSVPTLGRTTQRQTLQASRSSSSFGRLRPRRTSLCRRGGSLSISVSLTLANGSSSRSSSSSSVSTRSSVDRDDLVETVNGVRGGRFVKLFSVGDVLRGGEGEEKSQLRDSKGRKVR